MLFLDGMVSITSVYPMTICTYAHIKLAIIIILALTQAVSTLKVLCRELFDSIAISAWSVRATIYSFCKVFQSERTLS